MKTGSQTTRITHQKAVPQHSDQLLRDIDREASLLLETSADPATAGPEVVSLQFHLALSLNAFARAPRLTAVEMLAAREAVASFLSRLAALAP